MTNSDYYLEKKWCDKCGDYVRYLMSVNRSFCTHCGCEVRLFSKEDSRRFAAHLERRKFRQTS